MKKYIKDLVPYIVIIIVVILIRTFIATPVIVVGDSMAPTLKEGQWLLLNKISYQFKEIERYDIVVIKMEKSEIIKRVIGLPGETIEYRNNILSCHNVGNSLKSFWRVGCQLFVFESYNHLSYVLII